MDFINTPQKCNDFGLYFYPTPWNIYIFTVTAKKKPNRPDGTKRAHATLYSLTRYLFLNSGHRFISLKQVIKYKKNKNIHYESYYFWNDLKKKWVRYTGICFQFWSWGIWDGRLAVWDHCLGWSWKWSPDRQNNDGCTNPTNKTKTKTHLETSEPWS